MVTRTVKIPAVTIEIVLPEGHHLSMGVKNIPMVIEYDPFGDHHLSTYLESAVIGKVVSLFVETRKE